MWDPGLANVTISRQKNFDISNMGYLFCYLKSLKMPLSSIKKFIIINISFSRGKEGIDYICHHDLFVSIIRKISKL